MVRQTTLRWFSMGASLLLMAGVLALSPGQPPLGQAAVDEAPGHPVTVLPAAPEATGPTELALARTLLVLERLQDARDAFPDDWVGGAGPDGEVEVVVIWDAERVHYDFVIPGEDGFDETMDAVRDWLNQTPDAQVTSYRFLADEHTGTYANVVLSLPDGIFWMQFDAEGRPTKLWVEPHEQFQPRLSWDEGAQAAPANGTSGANGH